MDIDGDYDDTEHFKGDFEVLCERIGINGVIEVYNAMESREFEWQDSLKINMANSTREDLEEYFECRADRERFVYELDDYGMTSDIYMLPVGTKFSVHNGGWSGEIVEQEGIKHMHVIYTGMLVKLTEDMDCKLVIRVKLSFYKEEKSMKTHITVYSNHIEKAISKAIEIVEESGETVLSGSFAFSYQRRLETESMIISAALASLSQRGHRNHEVYIDTVVDTGLIDNVILPTLTPKINKDGCSYEDGYIIKDHVHYF